MRREEFWYSFGLITEKLDSLGAWYSQLISQVKELEKQEVFYQDRTLQGIKGQLLERKESLLELFLQKNEIKFHLNRKYLPWFLKGITISPLLEQYSWGDRDKIEVILQQEESRLLEIEKQLSDLNYLSIDLTKLNQLIEEKFIEQLAQIGLKDVDKCDSIKEIGEAHQIIADYSIADGFLSSSRNSLGYLNSLQSLEN